MELKKLWWNTEKIIVLHGVLHVPDISDTLYYITEHGRQPDCLFMIDNGATAVDLVQPKTSAFSTGALI